VENNFLTTLTGQNAHQDSVKKSGTAAHSFNKESSSKTFGDAFHFKFLIVYHFFSSENGLNSNTE